MGSTEGLAGEAVVAVRNVGGIGETTVSLSPGVTVLVGRNASNRTSFLRALMAVCGSDRVSLKGDADRGRVEATIGDETYTRELRRRGDAVVTDGTPYLEDTTVADLFAFLLESNEARRAVLREIDTDLRDLIMRPVDTEAIQGEIERLESEKRRLDRELEALEDQAGELPDLERRRERLETEIEATRARLAEKETEIDAANADVETRREEQAALEEKLGELRETRSELEDVRYELETHKESIEALEAERAEVESALADLEPVDADRAAELDAAVTARRERKRATETELSELQNVIQFNEEMLAEETDLLDDGEATARLLEGDRVTCWTCGSDVDRGQIESTVDQLRETHRAKLEAIRELESEIGDLQSERDTLRETRERASDLESRRERLTAELETEREAVADRRERRDALSETVADLEAEVEDLEAGSFEDILALNREANELEFELGELESDLESVEADIADVESALGERERLESRREAVTDELTDLRTRIEATEREAIESFNERMATVLDILDYENVDRVWLERVEREVREGRQTVSQGAFELHIVRRTRSGTAYEDSIDHLSESEREVVGLVFALAGYLVHDVHETCPFVLLDSLEAIDAERIAALVEYFADYAPYLVVALLPDDAAALDDGYRRITDV
jgi:DNA repair exonuclease SbcCD ATPase subunit